MEPRKLFRSTRDSVIGGVCGGLAEYFDIDPVLVRVIFVILALVGGGGVLLYLILWIVIQKRPYDFSEARFEQDPVRDPDTGPPGQAETTDPDSPVKHQRGSLIAGVILLTLGFLFLVDEFIPRLDFGRLWPVILVVIGGVLIVNALNKKN